VEINPGYRQALGIEDGDMVEVASRRGAVRAKARITEKSSEVVAFVTFHFAETSTNVLNNSASTPVAKIPELKVCAVKLSRAGGD
jgi:formate dehydrogenase alpha subunit